MTFSERVKQVKNEKSLTSAELSERSGIPLGTLTKLLSGAITEPKLSTALAIAHALECPLGFLACCEDSFIAVGQVEVQLTERKKFSVVEQGHQVGNAGVSRGDVIEDEVGGIAVFQIFAELCFCFTVRHVGIVTEQDGHFRLVFAEIFDEKIHVLLVVGIVIEQQFEFFFFFFRLFFRFLNGRERRF